MKRVFFGGLPEDMASVNEAPATMTAPLIVLAVTSVLLGILPELVTGGLISQISSMIG
jgi:NADH:ubiquinone oxidoreductase subunit 5 (subunit L)/multisubunit Na+/H+ antiporter MnhA subunit